MIIYSFLNADLGTELVKEFPNLQGKIGGYLAKVENFLK
jgi:Glycyl-tRNA synthetase, beta subunit